MRPAGHTFIFGICARLMAAILVASTLLAGLVSQSRQIAAMAPVALRAGELAVPDAPLHQALREDAGKLVLRRSESLREPRVSDPFSGLFPGRDQTGAFPASWSGLDAARPAAARAPDSAPGRANAFREPYRPRAPPA